MLGTRIAVLRRQAGMSQAELARALKVSASTIGMYEQGRREPSIEGIVAIAHQFGVSTDYLLTGRPVSRQDSRILELAVRSLLEQARKTLFVRQPDGRLAPLADRDLGILLSAILD